MILFEEFCKWALEKGLDLEDDDDEGQAAVAPTLAPKAKSGLAPIGPPTAALDKRLSNLDQQIATLAPAAAG